MGEDCQCEREVEDSNYLVVRHGVYLRHIVGRASVLNRVVDTIGCNEAAKVSMGGYMEVGSVLERLALSKTGRTGYMSWSGRVVELSGCSRYR